MGHINDTWDKDHGGFSSLVPDDYGEHATPEEVGEVLDIKPLYTPTWGKPIDKTDPDYNKFDHDEEDEEVEED